MKYIIALPVCWFLFVVGSLAYSMLNLIDGKYWAACWYPIYNNFMAASVLVQDWGHGHQPWFPWGEVTK